MRPQARRICGGPIHLPPDGEYAILKKTRERALYRHPGIFRE